MFYEAFLAKVKLLLIFTKQLRKTLLEVLAILTPNFSQVSTFYSSLASNLFYVSFKKIKLLL